MKKLIIVLTFTSLFTIEQTNASLLG